MMNERQKLVYVEQGCECVTGSAGIATIIPDRDAEPSEIIQLADEAVYRAKRSGRDRVMG